MARVFPHGTPIDGVLVVKMRGPSALPGGLSSVLARLSMNGELQKETLIQSRVRDSNPSFTVSETVALPIRRTRNEVLLHHHLASWDQGELNPPTFRLRGGCSTS